VYSSTDAKKPIITNEIKLSLTTTEAERGSGGCAWKRATKKKKKTAAAMTSKLPSMWNKMWTIGGIVLLSIAAVKALPSSAASANLLEPKSSLLDAADDPDLQTASFLELVRKPHKPARGSLALIRQDLMQLEKIMGADRQNAMFDAEGAPVVDNLEKALHAKAAHEGLRLEKMDNGDDLFDQIEKHQDNGGRRENFHVKARKKAAWKLGDRLLGKSSELAQRLRARFGAKAACSSSEKGCFDSLEDLKTAVDDFLASKGKHGPPIAQWDVSRVKSLANLLPDDGDKKKRVDIRNFNEDLGKWDTSSVTDMSGTFMNAGSFNHPLDWDTSRVVNMDSTFSRATAFNQPLNWDTRKVTTMSDTFNGARAFNQPLKWDTRKVTDMAYTFDDATAFNQPLDWDMSKVTDMTRTFQYSEAFNSPLEWDTSSVTEMYQTFNGARAFNQQLKWDTSKVTIMFGTFSDKNKAFNSPLAWDTRKVTSMSVDRKDQWFSWGSKACSLLKPPNDHCE
jgi:surface protein